MKFKLLITFSTIFILTACSQEAAEVPVIDVEGYINKELALSLGNRMNSEDLAVATTKLIMEEPINELEKSISERKRIMKKAGKYHIDKEPVYEYNQPDNTVPKTNTGGTPNVDEILDRFDVSIDNYIEDVKSQEGLTEVEKYYQRLYNDILEELKKTKEWTAYDKKNREITEQMFHELLSVKDLKEVEVIRDKIFLKMQNTAEYTSLIKVRDVLMEKRHLALEAQLMEELIEDLEDVNIEETIPNELNDNNEQDIEIEEANDSQE